MIDVDTRSVSLAASELTWTEVDERAKKLGLDRSKYVQQLLGIEIENDLLNNKKIFEKKIISFIDITIILLLIGIIVIAISGFFLLR